MHVRRIGRKQGFALPTVLIASVVLLTVLAVSVSATVSVRTTLKNQYYAQLAQIAGEAGVAYAKACLDANRNIPQWTDAKPLTPGTTCSGDPIGGGSVNVLVVAGGGGGGSWGGGGGAGGLLTSTNESVSVGTTPVVVGGGGAGAPAGGSGTQGTNGNNSSFAALIAEGGGGGGGSNGNGSAVATIAPGRDGGSGGGASVVRSGSPASNFAGGIGTAGNDGGDGAAPNSSSLYVAGGGGGAGGAGANAGTIAGSGAGGTAYTSSITGSAVAYAGGGGGGERGTTTLVGAGGGGGAGGGVLNAAGSNATASTGSGGGGGSMNGTAIMAGGNGGSGVVIIAYPTGSISATGGTVTTSGGNTIHRFTSSGNFVVTSTGAVSCPGDSRCYVTINENLRSSFRVGLPTLDSSGKASTIPNTGYVELLRTSTGTVWRTYNQPAVQSATVPDLCSGAATAAQGWNAAALASNQLVLPAEAGAAQTISNSTGSIPFGSVYFRKDFSVTEAGTYNVGIQTFGGMDDAYFFVDGEYIAGSVNGAIATAPVSLGVGCHTAFVRMVNHNNVLVNNTARFAGAIMKPGGSIPLVITDRSWRASAGSVVNFSDVDFDADPEYWTIVRDISTAVSVNSTWTATSSDSLSRWLSTTHNLSGANYPSAEYAFFRDGKTVTVASDTQVKLSYLCDDSCTIYLDGAAVAAGDYSGVSTTTLTLTAGTHQFGVALYNNTGGSGFGLAVTQTSNNAVLTRSDPGWIAGFDWMGTDVPPSSYAASFRPTPDLEPTNSLVNILTVGGGGGGGGTVGGGGGGGGVNYTTGNRLRVQAYPVVVGAGGLGGIGWNNAGGAGSVGGDSSVNGQYGVGGGGGASSTAYGPTAGGSGGGGAFTPFAESSTGVIGQGFAGGSGNNTDGGGGGGAGAAGVNLGNGGAGRSISITGSAVTYGGGGGGGARDSSGTVGTGGAGGGGTGTSNSALAGAGGANLGGGGGGAGYRNTSTSRLGGTGGTGVVIISYPTGTMTATGGTITTSGGNTIHRFTSSGTFTVTSIPVAVQRGVNVAGSFGSWTLGGGATYNAGTGEITMVNTTSVATSPKFRVENIGLIKMGGEFYGTAPVSNWTPLGGFYVQSNYYAEDGVTPVGNTASSTANGCSRSLTLNTWVTNTTGCTTQGGPNVKYVVVHFNGTPTWASAGLRIRNPSVIFN